jgi:hypothetical protein
MKLLFGFALLVSGLLVGCATTVEPVADPSELRLLGFLEAGSVSRSEVEGRLGGPREAYEDGRIVIYALRKNQDKFESVVLDSQESRYRLILVYRPDGQVERWNLVDRKHR